MRLFPRPASSLLPQDARCLRAMASPFVAKATAPVSRGRFGYFVSFADWYVSSASTAVSLPEAYWSV